MTRGAAVRPLPAHGTLSRYKYHGCKCLVCLDAYAQYQALRRRKIGYGTWHALVDAGPAREHIAVLNARGMTWEQIAYQAGVETYVLRRLRGAAGRPRVERVKPDFAKRLLAVRFTVKAATSKSLVQSVGVVRRLQALRAIGWPVGELAWRIGVHRKTVSNMMRDEFVQALTHERVVTVFDDLRDLDPRLMGVSESTVRRATAYAARCGWAKPSQWRGDIDDPAAVPGRPSGPMYAPRDAGPSKAEAIVENTADLARAGESRELIAARIGESWNYITVAHARQGVKVPEVRS